MKQQPKWDERYQANTFAYGKAPNVFFKEWLPQFTPTGHILMPADGEGRNGVFAATLGWQVTAVDLSKEGKNKALQLAQEQGVNIDYRVNDLGKIQFPAESFDAVGLIYAHFAADKKTAYHQQLHRCLKPGGIVILEAFSKNHVRLSALNPKVGGPKEVAMLYSKEEILADFKGYEILKLAEEETELNEGQYHIGRGSVIRFVGRKV